MGNIGGILIGVAIIAVLLFAMDRMTVAGTDANRNFCDGDCKSCKAELEEELCRKTAER